MTTRRVFLAAASAAALLARARPARAADVTLKFGNDNPATHPVNIRMQEAASRIAAETNGRVRIDIFPNNQLGGDTDMLSQLRTGALQMLALGGNILSTLVPVASITGVAFIFPDYDAVWRTVDGSVGAMIRSAVASKGLVAFDKPWDNGFRQITSSTKPIVGPESLEGFRIRIPVSPLWTSTFVDLGASPVSLNASEMYSALQTHVADGQENSLAIIDSFKLYEVQKYCSLTNHIWEGYWFLANAGYWDKLPSDVQSVIAKHVNAAALAERADIAQQNTALQPKLTALGMTFNPVDQKPFKEKLLRAGYYGLWQGKFGQAAWDTLRRNVSIPG